MPPDMPRRGASSSFWVSGRRRPCAATIAIRSVQREFEIELRKALLANGSVPALLALLPRSGASPGPGHSIRIANQVNTAGASDADDRPKRKAISENAVRFVVDQFLMGRHAPDECEYIDAPEPEPG